jgi:hypothetical protein
MLFYQKNEYFLFHVSLLHNLKLLFINFKDFLQDFVLFIEVILFGFIDDYIICEFSLIFKKNYLSQLLTFMSIS